MFLQEQKCLTSSGDHARSLLHLSELLRLLMDSNSTGSMSVSTAFEAGAVGKYGESQARPGTCGLLAHILLWLSVLASTKSLLSTDRRNHYPSSDVCCYSGTTQLATGRRDVRKTVSQSYTYKTSSCLEHSVLGEREQVLLHHPLQIQCDSF